ncbi:UNVERIFIED_CONTAM: hypothetical protein FKN15_063459 [Acipenser sinensis]
MSPKRFLEGQVYSVPLIQPDLRREEAIHQIADALQYLETISCDIFARVSRSVEKNRTHLQTVTDRIKLAQARIDKIKGSKKATKVFSSAKFPAPDRLQDYSSIFSGAADPSSQKRPRYKVQGKHRPLDEQALQEKLMYFPVCANAKRRSEDETEEGLGGLPRNISSEKLMYFPVCANAKRRSEDETEEGLGGLPRNISSVSSLLLFNTTENLYKKYVFLDPLAGAVTKTQNTLETEKEKPFDAPLSMTKREQLERQTAENYFYVPDLGQVPEIDVPSYLPDLPGIADDLSYSADLGPGIAPSGAASSIPELPSFGTEAGELSSPALVRGTPLEVVKPSDGRASLLESIREAGGIGKAKLRDVKERKKEKKKQKEQEQGTQGFVVLRFSDIHSEQREHDV